MSKYLKYPSYRDSGVEWLGEIPDHWTKVAIKRMSTVGRGASPRPIDDPKYFDDNGEYAWVRIADVSKSNGYLDTTQQQLSKLGSSLSVKIQPNDIFVSIAGTVGKPCITNIKACIHDGFVYFPQLSSKYIQLLYRIFEAGQCYGGLGKMGTQLNLNTETIGAIHLGIAPDDELELIIKYIEVATAKIDTLIEKQTKLIALLKEKRQAVISTAVTRGLDNTVAMKDSGVEWLGEIPQGWEGTLLKYHTKKITDGAHVSPDLNNGEYYFVSVKDITSGKIILDSALLTSHESYKYLVQTGCRPIKGDILLGKDGTIGVTAVVESNIEFVVASSLIIIRPSKNQYPKFINYCCMANFFQDQISRFVKGAGLKRLSIQNLLKIYSIFPPLQEQQTIADYLDEKTIKIDTLIAKATKAIDLLKEKRTALISSAVTGKIDVREAS